MAASTSAALRSVARNKPRCPPADSQSHLFSIYQLSILDRIRILSQRWDPSFAPHEDGTCSTGGHGSSSECAGPGRIHSIEDTITRTKELQALQHLIIVPGHGVWQGYTAETVYNESAWALEHYQQGDGARTRIDAFVGHIRKGFVTS